MNPKFKIGDKVLVSYPKFVINPDGTEHCPFCNLLCSGEMRQYDKYTFTIASDFINIETWVAWQLKDSDGKKLQYYTSSPWLFCEHWLTLVEEESKLNLIKVKGNRLDFVMKENSETAETRIT